MGVVTVDQPFVIEKPPQVAEANKAPLTGLLQAAKSFAHPFLSQFYVGAMVLGASGKGYLGNNFDFLGQPLSQSIHAEQSAVALARLHGETALTHVVVSAPPCGHCRQFLLELGTPDLQITVINRDAYQTFALSELIPFPFSYADDKVNLLSPQAVPLRLTEEASDPLSQAALEGASKAYSPYTQSFIGVALGTGTGQIFQGSLLESAAYNPSLPPLQSALVHLVSEHGDLKTITAAALVCASDASVSMVDYTASVLKSYCPQVVLSVKKAVVAGKPRFENKIEIT